MSPSPHHLSSCSCLSVVTVTLPSAKRLKRGGNSAPRLTSNPTHAAWPPVQSALRFLMLYNSIAFGEVFSHHTAAPVRLLGLSDMPDIISAFLLELDLI